MTDEYEGRPLLKLVECFVLRSIDGLSLQSEQVLATLAPKLQQVYGVSGTWDVIIKQVLELPDGIEGEICQMWDASRQAASDAGVTLTPAEFAVAYVNKFFLGEGR